MLTHPGPPLVWILRKTHSLRSGPDVTFQLDDGGGTIHTHAQITGKAASMGEGVVIGVLDALITDFTSKLGQI